MKRNMMTRFSAGCLTLLLMFGSVCRVQAAQEPAEPNAGQSAEQMVQTGSVTVQLTPGKEGTPTRASDKNFHFKDSIINELN